MSIKIKNVWEAMRGERPSYSVSEVRRLAPQLAEVVAEAVRAGPSLAFSPGDKIKINVGKAMRSYTPAELTAEKLRFTGVLHGGGPGSDWLEALCPGDPIRFFGPAHSLRPASRDVDWAAFAGDETTLGAAEALLGALPDRVDRFGALEVHKDSARAVEAMKLPASVFARTDRGAELLRWAETVTFPAGEGMLWLSGEASSLVPVKRVLLERGLKSHMLCVKPY